MLSLGSLCSSKFDVLGEAIVVISKTDKSERRQVGFGGKGLTDENLPQLFLGLFSFQPIIVFVFVLFFSVPANLVVKRCGRRLGGQFG
jgi:hypothetical protein